MRDVQKKVNQYVNLRCPISPTNFCHCNKTIHRYSEHTIAFKKFVK